MENFLTWCVMIGIFVVAYTMGYIKGHDTGNSVECTAYVQESSYQK